MTFLRSIVACCHRRMPATPLLAILLFFTIAPAAAESPLLITHGPRTAPRVALTFDLCQVPKHPSGFDRGVIDTLRSTRTPATLFIGGDWLRTHLKERQELAAEPLFELANHSWDHPDLRRRDADSIRAEIVRTEELLQQSFGKTSRLFRLPFGYYDERVLQAAAATGVRIIQWDVVSGDPDRNISAERLIAGVTSGVRNGSIVVMHANGRGWHTAEALPTIIARLRSKGFELVTVSELLDGIASGAAQTTTAP